MRGPTADTCTFVSLGPQILRDRVLFCTRCSHLGTGHFFCDPCVWQILFRICVSPDKYKSWIRTSSSRKLYFLNDSNFWCVQSSITHTIWPSMCCGLFAPTQFQFECACVGREGVVRTKAVLRSRVFGCGSCVGYVSVFFLEVLAVLVCCGQAKVFSGAPVCCLCCVSPRQACFSAGRVVLLWPVLVLAYVSWLSRLLRGRPGWAAVWCWPSVRSSFLRFSSRSSSMAFPSTSRYFVF